MAVPIHVPRLAALGLGFTTVCAASILVPDPQFRVLLVWAGFAPFLWAIWPRGAGAGRGHGGGRHARDGEAGLIPVEDFERVARQLESRVAAPADGAGVRAPARGRSRSTATAVSGPSPARDATPHRVPAAASARESFPVQRRFHGMRRMTEQYLREVRRMNLVAMWGREGSIPRRQALDQIREIEGRMRHLSERMKFVAGRARN